VPPTFSDAVAELKARLDRIQVLSDQLAKVRNDATEQQTLAEKIRREIQAAHRALQPAQRSR
jgi:hypothetical protein